MATQSTAPPDTPDGNPQNPAAESVQPTAKDQQDANIGATKETSMSVNTEPLREDQVQNAVKFLSHPKVKGSPVMYRRSFLERKGLTKEEIDEAFRRVPDESPSLSTTQPADANQGGQSQPLSLTQPQVPTQSLQPVAAAPGASRFRWSRALLAIGVLASSGAGTAVVFKNAIVPRLKSWIRKVVLEDEEEGLAKTTNAKPTIAEEAAAAAKAAAVAASDVARASQEMLISKSEEKRYFGELMSLLDMQVQEMKSMSTSIRKLEGQSNNLGREGSRLQVTNSRVNAQPSYVNGNDSRSVRSLSPPHASVEPSTAPPHPKSYAEIMAMVQRGEKPPNIREINDLPPNPDQPVSNPRLAPRPKPWETAPPQVGWTLPQENGYGQDNGSVSRSSWVPPQPPAVAMAEAAAAIRQPKKPPVHQEQQATDERLSAEGVADELQRVTKMSESGGISVSEIQIEEGRSYVEA